MSIASLKNFLFTFLFNFAILNLLQQLFLIPVNIFGNLFIVKYLLQPRFELSISFVLKMHHLSSGALTISPD
jgi:hypothetical protein